MLVLNFKIGTFVWFTSLNRLSEEIEKPCIIGRHKAPCLKFGSPYKIRTRITIVKEFLFKFQ
jgi:hypothetical protein